MALDKPYKDIPGTTIFDADMARQGFALNQFSLSLMKAPNRERFKADERAYLDEWPMTEEQKQAVLDRDYNRMMALGGNVYFLAKIFSTDGLSFQHAASTMTGMSPEEYRDMMLAGGRSPEGNLYKEESNDGQD
ncbi:MAG: protocatechuate 4,5-dioxygenase subunit alpha [Haliea sp.]|uniref:protocatechuate 4,5-dioxygenase subunit alpha n=1 Tax=Haliea sp. TaxID=1932666 RepID=UPI000C6AC5E3|nr:protocatechuate 4,5-dioxygenase subunit alpha [Haliea sp.]MBM68100.1 protocatechuate 4,5-dioxygenase subunit alpha [Haliea sp.]|tara:strand:- start:10702 stop:11103 length:402 start_codon:yes stop_codon:yes gene_type:complete